MHKNTFILQLNTTHIQAPTCIRIFTYMYIKNRMNMNINVTLLHTGNLVNIQAAFYLLLSYSPLTFSKFDSHFAYSECKLSKTTTTEGMDDGRHGKLFKLRKHLYDLFIRKNESLLFRCACCLRKSWNKM